MTATETMVRERPILFSGPMVRAILDGHKSQTRRVVRMPGGLPHDVIELTRMQPGFADGTTRPVWDFDGDPNAFSTRCPYGQPGDRLWVRETCVLYERRAWYRASGPLPVIEGVRWKWTPAIHMPRWASRLTLELTGVRVERLQQISAQDAISEGRHLDPRCDGYFPDTWNAINAARGFGWDANPWVWVLEFQRITT